MQSKDKTPEIPKTISFTPFEEHLIPKQEENSNSTISGLIQILYCINHAKETCLITRVAGADTTALSLTFALYYMVKDKRVYERLCKEIRERFGSKEEITGQTAATLTFLEAAIQEGNYKPDIILDFVDGSIEDTACGGRSSVAENSSP